MNKASLPPELQDEVAEIAFREPSLEGRALRYEELIARHPQHAAALRAHAGAADPLPDSIGPFRILALLGEGGFGHVYRAQQTAGVDRMVALKVLRTGVDSRAVLARFELERQVLAAMNHDGIARFFEAGQVDDQLWFSMELVEGQPLTSHCDENHLSVAERVRLFLQVCDGVQHAHGKGIVHRDLKPANVLVTRSEHGHAAKIIDFGIARATDRQLSQSMQTMLGMVLGTPEYMAPEQCGGDPISIDARTDVYALGAMLYELLTGQLPFDSSQLPRNDLLTVQNVLRNQEPPLPSSRITTLGARSSEMAARRSVSPTAWRRAVQGDLDHIVGHAMEKDPPRRYQSVADLAADLRRHLQYEPIVARPPSGAYRLRKFLRRYRGQVAAGAAVVLTAIVGAVVSLDFAFAEKKRAEENAQLAKDKGELLVSESAAKDLAAGHAREATARAAELKLVADFQGSRLDQIDPQAMGEGLRRSLLDAVPADHREDTEADVAGVNFTELAMGMLDSHVFDHALAAIERDFEGQPLVKAQLLQTTALTLRRLGRLEAASSPQEQAVAIRRRELGDDDKNTLESLIALAQLRQMQGNSAEGVALALDVLPRCRKVLGNENPFTLTMIRDLGGLLLHSGRSGDAEPLLREAVERGRVALGAEHTVTLTSMLSLADLLVEQGRLAEAEPCCRDALSGMSRALGDTHTNTLLAMNTWAALLEKQGKFQEAESQIRLALGRYRGVRGENHLHTLRMIDNLATALRNQGKLAEAEPLARESVERHGQVLGGEHPSTLTAIVNLGHLYLEQGKTLAAEPLLREVEATARRTLGDQHATTVRTIACRGGAFFRQGKLRDAEPLLREVAANSPAAFGENGPETVMSLRNLGDLLRAQGKLEEAESQYRNAYDRALHALGEAHPATSSAGVHLAMVLRDLGKSGEAETLLQAAVARLSTLGSKQPEYLEAANALGVLLNERGRRSEAEPLLREALDGYRRAFGEETPGYLSSLSALALLLQQDNRLEEAEPLRRQALDQSRKVFGENHPTTLSSLHNLGLLLEAQGNLVEAVSVAREVLDKCRTVLATDHHHTLLAMHRLGLVMARRGELLEAEPVQREALERRRRVLGNDHPYTLMSIRDLGSLLTRLDKLDEAEALLREELAAHRRLPGNRDTRKLESIHGLGNLLLQRGDSAGAEPLLREALSGYELAFGKASKLTMAPRLDLARNLVASGRPKEAIDLLQPEEQAFRATLASEPRRVATFSTTLGKALFMNEAAPGFAAAETLLREAHELLANEKVT